MLKSKIWFLISGLALLAVGIWAVVQPVGAVAAVAVFIGIAALISGISHLVAYFSDRDKMAASGWVLARGILDTLVGILLLFNLPATMLVLPLVFGVWAIFTGIVYVSGSFSARAADVKNWWLILIGGLLSVAIGVLMVAKPLTGVWIIALEMGYFFILFGASALISAFGSE